MGVLDGKVAVVTGGTSGIGKAAATGLARAGATVVLVARNRAHADATLSDIRAAVAGARLEVVEGDLASLATVRTAAAEIAQRHPAVHVLLCSAGVFHKERADTVDGIERTFQVNYLSHFLLANLLAGPLRAGAPSRVVFVASKYGSMKIDFDDLMVKQRKFTPLNSVAPTKLGEVLLAQELAERWASSGVVVNAIHPGLVRHTNLLTEVGGGWKFMTNLFGSTTEKGADTAVWLATAPEAASATGKLWAKRRPIPTPGQGSDPAARKRLWDVSLKLAGLA
jgi:retinol dehydrogenase-12